MSEEIKGFDSDKEYTDEYFKYRMQSDGTFSVEILKAKERLSVPREFQKIPVTAVVGNENEIPSGADGVLSVKLSPGLRRIGRRAFFGFRNLLVINIPSTVEVIEAFAFSGCESLEGITVGRGVISILDEAFSGCKSLCEVKLPDSLISIDDRAFFGCKSLKKIKIPKLVNSIGDCAFSHCDSLMSFEVDDKNSFFTTFCGALFSKNTERLLKYPGAPTVSQFLMPNSVKSVSRDAFLDAKSLKRIFISDSLEEVEGDDLIPLSKNEEPRRIASRCEIGKLYGRISVFARIQE